MTFGLAVSLLFFAFTLIGLVANTVIFGTLFSWVRKPAPKPRYFPGISILKPLCGVDDDLERNLEEFSKLDYPNYELLLGVKSKQDPAYAVAQAVVKRHPGRVRLMLQRGEPGMNPKVNQLITLGGAAKHDILLVSDSNVRVPPGYLTEIAGHFEDPQVACVTSPIVGVGEKRLGSMMDNMHLGMAIGPGMVAAKVAGGQDIVVGKSMAMRRKDLEAMGGFYAARNHLAEDYVLGGRVRAELGKRVAVCHLPVYNVSQNRSVKDFFSRYLRWSVIHRTSIAFTTYISQAWLNPTPLAVIAFLLHPTRAAALAVVGVALLKGILDMATVRQLRQEGFGFWAPLVSLVKDFLIFAAWFNGLYDRTVVWRGNKLRVHHGSRLIPLEPATPEPLPLEPANAWSEAGEPDNRQVA